MGVFDIKCVLTTPGCPHELGPYRETPLVGVAEAFERQKIATTRGSYVMDLHFLVLPRRRSQGVSGCFGI